MYRAVLFDLDDTLYDLRSYWTGRLVRAFDTVVARYPTLEREALVRTAIAEKVYAAKLPAFLRRHAVTDEALVNSVAANFEQNWFEELVLAEDALQTLALLRQTYRIGLITNGPSEIQRRKIERFGLARHMDVLLVSGEVGIAKPEPEIFFLALAQLGVAPAEALFVGDSLEFDLRGAAAAGLPFVWINRRHETLPDGIPKPHAVITRLAELPSLIEKRDI